MNLDDDVKFNSINSKGEYDGPRQNASKVDLYLTTSKYSVKKYIAHSGRAIFIPPGANPEIFKPLNLKIKYDVVFIGQIYGVRKRLIESLKKSGINVAVFGRNSHTCIPTINEMNYIWNQSYIVLGHGGIGYSWDTRNIKGRDFEAIVSGACYITTYHPVLDEIFQEYNDIVFYKNTQECIAKIKMLLNDKSLIDKIKHNARMIRNEHTWEKRMINVMSRLGIGNHDSGYIDH